MVEDYNNKVFIPILVKVFFSTWHTFTLIIDPIFLNDSLFGASTSHEEVSEGLFKA